MFNNRTFVKSWLKTEACIHALKHTIQWTINLNFCHWSSHKSPACCNTLVLTLNWYDFSVFITLILQTPPFVMENTATVFMNTLNVCQIFLTHVHTNLSETQLCNGVYSKWQQLKNKSHSKGVPKQTLTIICCLLSG